MSHRSSHARWPRAGTVPGPGRRRPRLGGVLLLVLGLAACGDATAPEEKSLILPFDSLVLREISARERLQVRAGTRTTAYPELNVVAERRWIGSLPVLDPDSLRSSGIVAMAPGEVDLSVKAFGAEARLRVSVRPEGSVAVDVQPRAVTSGDTLLVLGYRLDEVRAVTIAGAFAEVFGGDSARLGVVVPPLDKTEDVGCRGRGAPLLMDLEPGRTAPSLTLSAARRGQLLLDRGEARVLDPSEAECLRLAPGQEYALAYYDTRMLERARSGHEGDWQLETITIGVEDRSRVDPSPTRVRRCAPRQPWEADLGMGVQAPSAGESQDRCRLEELIRFRDEPWSVGERFPLCWNENQPREVVEVFQIHGPLVFVAHTSASDGVARLEEAFDSAGTEAAASVPFLNRIFDIETPASAEGNGQLLIRVIDEQGTPQGLGGPTGVVLNLWHGTRGASDLLWLLGHELTHTWQGNHRISRVRDWSAVETTFSRWALEGGASFIGYEIVRRFLGIGLRDNIVWWPFDDTWAYAREVAEAGGAFHGGYDQASSYFRHVLVGRLDRTGEPYEEVVRDLVQGSIEGWWGQEPNGIDGPGLVARMREALGEEWSPEEAMLDWAMSHAMDDRVEGARHRNPAFFGVSSHPLDRYGWRARGTLGRAGDPGFAEIVEGEGSAGFVTLHAPEGGTFRLHGDSLVWMVGRIR